MSTVIACGGALNKMVTEGYLEKVLAIALPLEEVEGAVVYEKQHIYLKLSSRRGGRMPSTRFGA